MKLIEWINGLTKLNKTTMDTFQGNINTAIEEKLGKTGGTLEGDLISQSIIPTETDKYNIGSPYKEFNTGYFKKLRFNGGNLIGFKWMETDLAIEIDNSVRYIPVMEGHSIHLAWTESGLGIYIDNTFVGNVTLTK